MALTYLNIYMVDITFGYYALPTLKLGLFIPFNNVMLIHTVKQSDLLC